MKQTAADRARNVPNRRQRLIAALGGRCQYCGETEDLEFHHVGRKRTWVARETSRWRRIKLYEEEAAAGVIELRCGDCNKTEPTEADLCKAYADEVPF